ncbi:MAG: nuclear transport factor 2 family protein [Gemmatimonadales bacterium]
MSAHEQVIRTFYAAFQRRDHRAMAGCYAPDPRFTDPVFRTLEGLRVAAMWRMLCERATDLRVEVSNVQVDGHTGSADWEARYTFTPTGRKVRNRIHASFEFAGGRISRHQDEFDLHAWARQALGPKGLLLGWTPLVQKAIRAQARKSLDKFIQSS